MRRLLLVLAIIMTNSCSVSQVLSEFGLRETTIEEIVAPNNVKVGEPIKVALKVLEPTSCDEFKHIRIEKADGNKLYIFRAFNSDVSGREDHCALIADYTNTEYIINDAPAGVVTLVSGDRSVKVIVNVER